MDGHLDIRLARLAPSRGGDECELDSAGVLRLLDILNEVSDGARLVLVLGHLTAHADPQIASKAALLTGRRIQNAAWVERNRHSSDARLRANVIEALWGRNLPWAREAVRSALGDDNNRVAGNALMGLFLLRDPSFPGLAIQMLRDARPAFRQTAAWAMGRSGDPRFLDILRGAMSDPEAGVRHSATRALVAIRRPAPSRHTASIAALADAARAAEQPAASLSGSGAARRAGARSRGVRRSGFPPPPGRQTHQQPLTGCKKRLPAPAKDRRGRLSHNAESAVCGPSGTGLLAGRGVFQQPASGGECFSLPCPA